MDGILIVYKEVGYTSQDVVSKAKKILNEKKAGHAGTLDPMAEGVLPVLLGKCTKLSKYLINHDKTYEAIIKLGEKRDTGDSEGNIIENRSLEKYTGKEINDVLKSLLGKNKQKPPMYSAIKVNGKKLYEYAREGVQIEVKSRDIEIYDIRLLKYDLDKSEISFEVSCSKGTYIRTLCEDIAEKLGTVGYMKELIRTKVDKFSIDQAIRLDDITLENLPLIKMEQYFDNINNIVLNKRKSELFLNGVMLSFDYDDGLYNVYNNDTYLGLGTIKNKLLKRDIII